MQYGLVYPENFLDGLPVIQKRPAPHAPIYAISAAQYAQLVEHYSLADVDDSVLFPFLHGLEGDNDAQNLFFSHSRVRDGLPSQVHVPRYRGLMSVACPADEDEGPMNTDMESSDSSDSALDHFGFEDDSQNATTPSAPTPAYRDEFTQSGSSSSSGWTLNSAHHQRQHSPSVSSAASSASPLSASTTATSLWSESPLHANDPSCDNNSALTESPPPAQPHSATCRLISSVLHHEILNYSESRFVKPLIPEGISLRNFGTQVPIYASLSDIVLYSPRGATKTVLDLAERIKDAIEAKVVDRNAGEAVQAGSQPGVFANGLMAYNVFVVTDSFEVFERDHPDLVSLDSRGKPMRHIDFMAREKEEMRQLTQATPICDSVWLGNTADVPIVSVASLMSDVDPFDTADNTQGWDICIECRDDAYFPTPAHLRHAEEHIAKLDAVWAAQLPNLVQSPSTESPSSGTSTPPLSPTLLGLSNLRVQTTSPAPFRTNSVDALMRSRSSSPSPGENGRRPTINRGASSVSLSAGSRRQSPSPLQQQAPPRPPPNPRSIVHLSFPSSPPSNPHTTAQIINMLAFLSRYADPYGYTEYAFPQPASSSKRRGSLSSNLSTQSTSSSMAMSLQLNSAYQYHPQPPTAHTRPLRILLHSMDGYTETSVLALCYLMFSKKVKLPEAYLELQIERSRSFFVCPGDMGVLRRVESTLSTIVSQNGVDGERRREEKVARRERERANAAGGHHSKTNGIPEFNHHQLNGVGENAIVSSNAASPVDVPNGNGNRWGKWSGSWRSSSLSLGPMFSSLASGAGIAPHDTSSMGAPPSANTTPTSSPVHNHSLAHSATLPSSKSSASLASTSSTFGTTSATGTSSTGMKFPPVQRARALTSPVVLPSRMDHSAWFMDPRFDGSFPSRVLPHLYLGNLNHASNAYMLHALGITHVVSVGECALVPPVCPMPRPGGTIEPGTQISLNDNGSSFVYGSGPNGQGSLWIEEREGRIKVLDIKGVSDDGIDSLRPQFAPICEWIEKARQENGKVLVHCRVGVSRSATVTIAYVMKYHHMSLVDAYLLVRSRRLSILIQPNMRLLYNLVGWEIELAKDKAGREGREKCPLDGRLTWPYLAREVHRLNERYLT